MPLHIPKTVIPFALAAAVFGLLLTDTMPGVALAAESIPQAETEPEVSAEEATVLQNAAKAAEEDGPEAAAELLAGRINADSSAALDFALGIYAAESNQAQLALKSFQQALTKAPEFHRARLQWGRVLLREQAYADAAAVLRPLLDSSFGRQDTAWVLLAYAYAAENRHTAAESAYRQALVRNPENTQAKLGILRSLAAQERIDDAQSLIEELLHERPGEADLWQAMAHGSLKKNERLRALVMLECSRRLDLAGPETLATLADLYLDQGMPAVAVEVYREIVPLEQAPLARILSAANALIQMQELPEARELLAAVKPRQNALSKPQIQELRLLTARLLNAEGKVDEAVTIYREVLTNDPLAGKVLLELGRIELTRERFTEAEVLFKRASRLDDYRAAALVALARVRVAQNRMQEAIPLLEKSLSVQPDEAIREYLRRIRDIAAD